MLKVAPKGVDKRKVEATRGVAARRWGPLAVLAVVAMILSACQLAPARGAPAAAPPSTAAPAADPASASSFLTRSGTQLTLDGHPYRVVSLDAYELATDWGQNVGCGGMLDDAALDSFFAGLPSGTAVRIWGFQGSMATNPATHTLNWGPLDRVVAAAAQYNVHLIVSLANQSGNCDDGHWKDAAWYEGGYRTLYPGDGSTIDTMSYWDWVQQIVTRYRNSPAIGMWELVNEPEASTCASGYTMSDCYGHLSCPDEATAAAALRGFYDTVGAEVKALDPNHLVESGADGGPQCGWVGSDAAYVNASRGVDVTSYHDYTPGQVITSDLQDRIDDSRTLDKPLIVGELGIEAGGTGATCPTLAGREALVSTKVNAMFGDGIAAVLLWGWVPNPAPTCAYDIGAGDPVLSLLSVSS